MLGGAAQNVGVLRSRIDEDADLSIPLFAYQLDSQRLQENMCASDIAARQRLLGLLVLLAFSFLG